VKRGSRKRRRQVDHWGRGWIETFWETAPNFRHDKTSTKIAPDNPFFSLRADGHAAIANQYRAKDCQDRQETRQIPFGVEILKDNKRRANRTACFFDNAQELVAKNIPKPTRLERGASAAYRNQSPRSGLAGAEIQNAGSHKEDVNLIKEGRLSPAKIKIRLLIASLVRVKNAQNFFERRSDPQRVQSPFHQRTIK